MMIGIFLMGELAIFQWKSIF